VKTLSPMLVDASEERELSISKKLAALDVSSKVIPVRLGADRVSVDYVWSANDGNVTEGVVAERKTVRDLIASVGDGRLERQLSVMTKFPHRFLLLHIKSLRDAQVSCAYANWTWERVLGVLRDVQYEGVPVEFVLGDDGVERSLVALYHWTGKDEHVSLHRPSPPVVTGMYMDPDYRAQVAMLICIPGIGEKAAVALLAQFGSVKGVCDASKQALLTVGGVGKQRAGTVAEFLAGRPAADRGRVRHTA
jgi:hypothetical protein